MSTDYELDRIDFAILAILQKNGRISNKRLAERVGLAPSTCLERVRRLVRNGVVRGFRTEVEPGWLGVGLQAIIAVRLRQHSRELVDAFRDYVLGLPEVRYAYHVAGVDDFLIHVAVEGSDQLRDLTLDAFTTRPEVDRIETRLIFEHTATWRLPNFVGGEGARPVDPGESALPYPRRSDPDVGRLGARRGDERRGGAAADHRS